MSLHDISDLDDAIIEDTTHCCVCGAAFVLGGNDGVPRIRGL